MKITIYPRDIEKFPELFSRENGKYGIYFDGGASHHWGAPTIKCGAIHVAPNERANGFLNFFDAPKSYWCSIIDNTIVKEWWEDDLNLPPDVEAQLRANQ